MRRDKRLLGAVGILGALAIWQLVSELGLISQQALPSASASLTALIGLMGTSEYWRNVQMTMTSWALGLTAAAVLGLSLGLAIGSSRRASKSTSLVIDFLRTIPPVTLIPLVVLMFGSSLQMTLVLVVLGTTWPILIQSIYGVREQDAVVREMARSYRLRPIDRFRKIILPSAAPFAMTGLRVAATIALLLSISSELVGGAEGLGQQIIIEQTNGRIQEMFGYILTTGLLGVLINLVFMRFQRYVLHWHPSVRGEAA